MNMNSHIISLYQAERLTGLPAALIRALVEAGELPSETCAGELYIGRVALFGWCNLFAQILAAVVRTQPRENIGGSISARNLVWMAKAGMLTVGKARARA